MEHKKGNNDRRWYDNNLSENALEQIKDAEKSLKTIDLPINKIKFLQELKKGFLFRTNPMEIAAQSFEKGIFTITFDKWCDKKIEELETDIQFEKRVNDLEKKEQSLDNNQFETVHLPEIQDKVSREFVTLFLHVLNNAKFDNRISDTSLSKLAAMLSGYSENSYRTRHFNNVPKIAEKEKGKYIKELKHLSNELGLTEFTAYIEDRFRNELQ